MKYFFLVILLLGSTITQAQPTSLGQSNTYAVVVGISKYQNLTIDEQLDFADRDALSFTEYLKSKAGGSVPEENIKLLVNEEATAAAITDALLWLTVTCNANDKAYFFFSGHGDLDNFLITKDGYLVSYDSPKGNYIHNAVSVDYLNKVANTLSARNNGKIILITDACHSGTLARDKKGPYLTADLLRKTEANEIRITSCDSNQLSNENQAWDGGHGAFTYYLLNGLKGLADYGSDGTVTVTELKHYLDSCFKTDPVINQKGDKQTPVIDAKNTKFKLADVDRLVKDSLLSKKENTQPPLLLTSLAPISKPAQTYFFEALALINPEEIIDFKKLATLPANEIPFQFIKLLADSNSYVKKKWLYKNVNLVFTDDKMAALENRLKNNADALKEFSRKLVVKLSNRGQQIINAYLKGDEAELERRRYYNSRSSGYDAFPDMFATALKLTEPGNELYHSLEVKQHYFAGIASRIKMPLVAESLQKKLLADAFKEEEKALRLEPNAAYIQNELGTLNLLSGNPGLAEKYYLSAIETAPGWAIPLANIANMYVQQKRYAAADTALAKAQQLQPELQNISIIKGLLSEKKGNLLVAEEMYHKSIKINSRHYLPFENLAFIYTNTTQYAIADSFFYEADLRKKGYHFLKGVGIFSLPFSPPFPPFPFHCDLNEADITDAPGYFAWGMKALNDGNIANAEKHLKKSILLDNNNPLAYYHLGKILYNQQRWQEADIIFNHAVKTYRDIISFNRYLDSLTKKLPATKSKDCIIKYAKHYHYDGIDNHYFLGSLYNKWQHYDEAIKQYRLLIRKTPKFIGCYNLLWNLQEKIGYYTDAEATIQSYTKINTDTANYELRKFYQRMTNRIPNSAEWNYRAGSFLYNIAAINPEKYTDDYKEISADSNKVIKRFAANTESVIADNIRQYTLPPPPTYDNIFIPGTQETVELAEEIRYPLSEAIVYLLKADSLLPDNEDALADINFKLGDLYVWQKIPELASPHYLKSVLLKPDNANARHNLIDTYNTTYEFTNALAQMDSLLRRNEINFDKQLMMAKYYIHAGRFTEATDLLSKAEKIYPYKNFFITELNGRLKMLANLPEEALPFYNDYLAKNVNDEQTMYTIARIYAKTNNKAEAWKWLTKAISSGFNYSWVLAFDEAWKSYRTDNKWTQLMKTVKEKKYTFPATSQQ